LSYRREHGQLYKNIALFKGVRKKVVGKI